MLGCDAESEGNRTPTFRNNTLSSFSKVEVSIGSIYLATRRHTQNNGIPSYTAAETSKQAIERFTPPQRGYRKLV